MAIPSNMVMLSALPTPPLFEDFMFQYRDDGVILNAEPYNGPFVDITEVSGLDNAPIRSTEHEREGMDGGFVDAEFESLRTITLKGTAYGDEYSLEGFLDTLKANFAPTRTVYPFYFRLSGTGIRLVYAKSLGVSYDIDSARRYGQTEVQFILKVEDPTIYGDEFYDSTGLASSTAGMGRGFNFGFPFGFGGSNQHGSFASVTNFGNRAANATLMISGPVTNPQIYHDQTGVLQKYEIVISGGDVLYVDLRNRTVRLNNVANRRNALKGAQPWFLLVPGLNTFRFTGTQHVAGPPNALFEVSGRSAYR